MTCNNIIERFCKYKGISITELIETERNPDIWYYRYILWHYLHVEKGIPTSTLSKIFKRNRPSVFRGIRLLKQQMFYHKDILKQYNDFIKKIEGMDDSTPSANMVEEN